MPENIMVQWAHHDDPDIYKFSLWLFNELKKEKGVVHIYDAETGEVLYIAE